MLFQLKGDTLYAENAALIVLSAAWNYPELETQIRDLGAAAVAAPARSRMHSWQIVSSTACFSWHAPAPRSTRSPTPTPKARSTCASSMAAWTQGLSSLLCGINMGSRCNRSTGQCMVGDFPDRLQTAAPTDTIRSVRFCYTAVGKFLAAACFADGGGTILAPISHPSIINLTLLPAALHQSPACQLQSLPPL